MNSFFQTQNLFAAIALSTVGLAATAGSATAFTVKGNITHAEYEALTVDSGVPWAAESRIGIVGPGDHEINIHDEDNNADRVQAEFDWINGAPVKFSLSFDQATKTLTYKVGDITLQEDRITENNFADLFIRTRAGTNAKKGGTGSSVVVGNLFLTDDTMSGSIGDISSATCDVAIGGCGYFDADYLHISDIVGSFTLTGHSTMSWGGTRPTRSALAYQIKLVETTGDDPTAVPAPAGLPFLSVGLAALRRKFGSKAE